LCLAGLHQPSVISLPSTHECFVALSCLKPLPQHVRAVRPSGCLSRPGTENKSSAVVNELRASISQTNVGRCNQKDQQRMASIQCPVTSSRRCRFLPQAAHHLCYSPSAPLGCLTVCHMIVLPRRSPASNEDGCGGEDEKRLIRHRRVTHTGEATAQPIKF